MKKRVYDLAGIFAGKMKVKWLKVTIKDFFEWWINKNKKLLKLYWSLLGQPWEIA